MRFFLACVVMMSHLDIASMVDTDWTKKLGPDAAVLGFFMISGYSIAASLERERSGYLMRRANRIFPLMLVSLLLTMVVAAIFGGEIATARGLARFPNLPTLLGNILLLQGFVCHTTEFNIPLWSLSIEWSYYLLAPWLSLRPARVLFILIAASSAICMLRPVFDPRGQFATDLYGISAASLFWGWLIGFALRRFRDDRLVRALVIWCPLVVGGFHPGDSKSLSAVTALLTSYALLYGREIRVRGRAAKWMNYLGELSFPLYIAHYPVFVALGSVYTSTSSRWINPVTACACALLLAVLLYHGIDAPLRKRRSKETVRRKGKTSFVIGYSRGNEPEARETASDDPEECKR